MEQPAAPPSRRRHRDGSSGDGGGLTLAALDDFDHQRSIATAHRRGPVGMPNAGFPPDRRRSLLRLARSGLWIAVASIAGGLAGGAYGYVTPPQFSVSSDVLIESDISLTGDLQAFEVTARDVVTQRSLLASPTVAAAASARSGLDLGEASTSSAQDSNIISVDVVQPTEALANTALEAYVRSYFDLVAERQRSQLEGELVMAQRSVQSAAEEAAFLDAVVEDASEEDRASLIGQQSAQRTTLADQLREGVERFERIEAALARLPVNLQRIDESPVPEPSGLTMVQWSMLGSVAGATVGLLVVLRIAERRS